jgi:FAD/FMN-containing dehydrogenase
MTLPHGFLDALREAIGADAVLTGDDARERRSFDAIDPGRLGPRAYLAAARVDAVARPAGTAQVGAVVRLAHEAGVGVVPYGGGTGVMGAVVPEHGGVALDLGRMNQVLAIDVEDRIAHVQPAVVLADLDAAARAHGLRLGHDPWSVGIATVGGAVSTDSLGYHAARFGSMGQQLRAAEVVLGDGTTVRTRPLPRQSSGPQLAGLWAGSEGTMGVLTELAVELFPVPEAQVFVSVGFDSFAQGFSVAVRMHDLGIRPVLFDLSEGETADEDAAGYRTVLRVCFEDARELAEAQAARTLAEGLAAGGIDLGPGPARSHWEARHDVAIRWKANLQPLLPSQRWERRRWANADYLHISMPVSRMLDYHARAMSITARHGLRVREAGIWTDPRLYGLFIYDPDEAQPAGRSAALAEGVEALLSLALELDGGVEFCHGLGAKLAGWAEREWGTALPLARRLKSAVDPAGVLSPGRLGFGPLAQEVR